MGFLEEHVKKNKKKVIETEHIAVRVEKAVADEFREHVGSLGLTVSDALRILIEKEMQDVRGVKGAPAPESLAAAPDEYKAVNKGFKPYSTDPTVNPKHGEIEAYVRRGRKGNKVLPCPKCGTWSSYHHFAERHAQKCGGLPTSAAYLKHPDVLPGVLEMMAAYDNEKEKARV